jgi:putative DNA primase/helicase
MSCLQPDPSIKPDYDMVERFLTALDPTSDRFTFQTYEESRSVVVSEHDWCAHILHGSLKKQWKDLCYYNSHHAGVSACINETDGMGRAAKNIVRVRAVFIDLDNTPLPESFHIKPHIITQTSPGRWHIYWRVKDCPLDQFTALQKRLVAHYGSDPGVCDLPHVMRLPGFFHCKYRPVQSQLIEAHCLDPYTLEEFTNNLPIKEEASKTEAVKKTDTSTWNTDTDVRLRSALAAIPTDEATLNEKFKDDKISSHMVWVNVGRALHRLDSGEKGFAIWRDWSRGNAEKFNGAGLQSQWDSFERTCNDTDKPIRIGTIFHYAKKFGWEEEEEEERAKTNSGTEPSTKSDEAPAYSEQAVALTLVDQNADKLRYVAKWGQWYLRGESCWREDEKREVFSIASKLCRETAMRLNKGSGRKDLAKAKFRAAVVSLVSDDPRIAATTDQWDADPWLLNTPDGVVDLRTGIMREHRAEDYMTKQAAVSPAGECPRWLQFLDEITAGNSELQYFLQRWFGYTLTGSTREHALSFGYGTGANGKSVVTETICGILGDYATTASIETFVVTHNEQHPTELARLRGARLVSASETEEGRRWAESKIKSLIGGDRVAARFMRQDHFQYTPQFKLWIVGNHKPGLRSVNEAIRRRFMLVPFTVTIPPAERDPDLAKKLKAEWPGILQWMIDGCLEWQMKGLAPPAAVTDATNAYLANADAIALWLEECTFVDKTATDGGWDSLAMLYQSWKEWSEGAGEYTGTQSRFADNLELKGLIPKRKPQARGYTGRRLLSRPEYAWERKGPDPDPEPEPELGL